MDKEAWNYDRSYQHVESDTEYETNEELQAKATRSDRTYQRFRSNRAPSKLIDEALTTIKRKSAKLLRQGSCETEAEHVQLLETIYQAGRNLLDSGQGIETALAKRIGAKAKADFFAVLIKAALPDVPKPVKKIWTGALTYAAASNVRAERLGGFFYLKGGLVKCGKTSPKKRAREIARWKKPKAEAADFEED